MTGDLARKMTFRSLYRLEESGQLRCPIIGVASDPWSQDQLVAAIRKALENSGQAIDAKTLAKLTRRFTYLQGDITEAATYESLAAVLHGSSRPLFYLEITPLPLRPGRRADSDTRGWPARDGNDREALRP